MLDGSNSSLEIFYWNGNLGLFLNPLNSTASAQHILTHLYESSSLLNPVVGMRFDPANPKITIGALDPNDYEGTINWIPLNPNPDPNGDSLNTFNFDGVKGYDGQFVPYGANLTAALDSRENTCFSILINSSLTPTLNQSPYPFSFPTPKRISTTPTRRDLFPRPFRLLNLAIPSNTTVRTLLKSRLKRRTSH